MEKIDEIVRQTIQEVSADFQSTELAYLALTTKIELPFRDRWAFRLHQILSLQGYIVSREWYRTDIAIHSGLGVPLALIELKAFYAFDVVEHNRSNLRKKLDEMLYDLEKARKLAKREKASPNIAIYTVLLIALPHKAIDKTFYQIMKYHPGVNKSFREHGKVETIEIETSKILKEEFMGKNVVVQGKHTGGSVYGTGMDVMYWLIKEQ